MHQLTRPSSPGCLRRYRYGRNTWCDVSPDEKTEIWRSLDLMQGYRCAYCEASLKMKSGQPEGHIEHFRQRKHHPQGTFDWQNLFGSCNRQESCGKHKDRQCYDHLDLIKMDEEDPEAYLRFLPEGSVEPADHLTPEAHRRATETIRVFNLNGPLREIRANHLIGYRQTAEELLAFAAEFEESEWRALLEEELRAIKGQPFETAIRHVLQVP
ncbi:retron Ec78 anti-phage system effector HNH endonuclease PtuB [Lamprobacter modestohalophilus]|uniref:retron Ec78 anti-phage system effector HNH endonuclease PtuB n=1 Tax=Lamprobacter modestohalophilus TaxID=1064514 RepID=UPI002ADEC32D|nr:retron Ec78 anti-phage system effector HNH endonuclease PtuB [Lamprobacter modestohalophilus]MEA1053398.1 retron Ec78 anti-phage system effector HNH endonuclease PtuB [Lamprobacter modestohalophilus]